MIIKFISSPQTMMGNGLTMIMSCKNYSYLTLNGKWVLLLEGYVYQNLELVSHYYYSGGYA